MPFARSSRSRRAGAPARIALCAASALGFAHVSSRTAHAQVVVSAEATAQVRFSRGRDAFMARDFATALTEFRAANELVASPNTRLYIARCLRELNHLAESSLEFNRAAAEASDRVATEPRYAATRDAARSEGAALQGRLGRLSVHVPHAPPGIRVLVGETPLPPAGWGVPTPVDPGEVEISATAPGRQAFRTRVTVQPGLEASTTIELAVDPTSAGLPGPGPAAGGDALPDHERPPPTPPEGALSAGPSATPPAATDVVPERRVREGGGARIGGVALLGVGVVSGALFGVFGSMARQRFDQLQLQCGPFAVMRMCDRTLEPMVAEGERAQLIANVSLGVGIASIALGTVLVIVGGPRERVVRDEGARSASPSASRRAPFAWRAWAAPQGLGALSAGVLGAF